MLAIQLHQGVAKMEVQKACNVAVSSRRVRLRADMYRWESWVFFLLRKVWSGGFPSALFMVLVTGHSGKSCLMIQTWSKGLDDTVYTGNVFFCADKLVLSYRFFWCRLCRNLWRFPPGCSDVRVSAFYKCWADLVVFLECFHASS